MENTSFSSFSMSFHCLSFTLPLALLSVGEDASRPVLCTSSKKSCLWSVDLLLAPVEEEINSLQESVLLHARY